MPAKPRWYNKLDLIIAALSDHPHRLIDRATLQSLLGVGRRRAQQILAPCAGVRIGASVLADKEVLIERLRLLAASDEAEQEARRRARLAHILSALRKEHLNRPKLLVEAPVSVVAQKFENLPAGVHLQAGRITVEFTEPREALEKLLALAMAVSNDFARFQRATSPAALDDARLEV